MAREKARWYQEKIRKQQKFEKEAEQLSLKELKKQIKIRAKRVNTTLRRLESQKLEKASTAYRFVEALNRDNLREGKEVNEFISLDTSNRFKYKTAVSNRTREELEAEYTSLKMYESSKTGTVTGVKRSVLKGYEKSGKDIFNSVEEYADFWRIKNIDVLVKIYGSGYIEEIKVNVQKWLEDLSKEDLEDILADMKTDISVTTVERQFDEAIENNKLSGKWKSNR